MSNIKLKQISLKTLSDYGFAHNLKICLKNFKTQPVLTDESLDELLLLEEKVLTKATIEELTRYGELIGCNLSFTYTNNKSVKGNVEKID